MIITFGYGTKDRFDVIGPESNKRLDSLWGGWGGCRTFPDLDLESTHRSCFVQSHYYAGRVWFASLVRCTNPFAYL